MALNVKAFLEKNGDVKGEIRRFQVPMKAPENEIYRLLLNKVAEVFSLPENGFHLFWQDTDGDFVTFSSSAEMSEAVHHSTDGVLRIYVKRVSAQEKATGGEKGGEKSSEEKVHHPGVVCDGCDGSIYGPRYKCVICPDYDLCAACEHKGLHPEHDKFKITHPLTAGGPGGFMPPHFRRWMHRFMKKCPAGYGQCPTGAANSAGDSAKSGEASSSGTRPQGPAFNEEQFHNNCDRDEFLNNVGANISAFLDPFGIDVTYEVRHGDEEKQKGHFRTSGQGSGPFVWQWSTTDNAGGSSCASQGTKPSTSAEKEKPAEKPEEAAEQPSGPEEMKDIPVTREYEVEMPESPQVRRRSREASPPGSDDDWTMLNEGDTTAQENTCNKEVAQAVEMMKVMGFNDDGGWLTRLLETTDGDIARALDTLKLGAQQASQLS